MSDYDQHTFEQRQLCRRFGAAFLSSPLDLKVGITENVRAGAFPMNGLRHTPEKDTTGWYIWAGEDISEDPDFFKPLHVKHLDQSCPLVLKYLGLPPGWRFLIADGYEDVWFDAKLLAHN